MSVEFDRGSPGKFDSRTLDRKTLNRWTGRKHKRMNNYFEAGGRDSAQHTRNERLMILLAHLRI